MVSKNLTPQELKELAKERLADAQALYEARRYEGAFYICGYAVEMGLKHKICKTLDWDEYPATENPEYRSLKTHRFDVLLHFSGAEKQKNAFVSEWSVVMKWDTEIRYSPQKQKAEDVKLMIEAAKTILDKL